MDLAFKSRVDLFLPYKGLDKAARRQVWEIFIQARRAKFDIDDAAIDSLSEVELNGREIKNLIKSANMLSPDEQVTMETLQSLVENRMAALQALDEEP